MARALAAALLSASKTGPTTNGPLGISAVAAPLLIPTKGASDPPPTYAESRPSIATSTDTIELPQTPTPTTPNISVPRDQKRLNSPSTTELDNPATRKVLLVEDNDINMKLLVATMKKLKRPYVCACNGLEAITAYASSPSSFALALMDISMPVMDGFTATEMIRAMEDKNGWPRCTVMALTGVGDAEAKKRAFLAGVDDFMTKPVSMGKLTSIVRGLGD